MSLERIRGRRCASWPLQILPRPQDPPYEILRATSEILVIRESLADSRPGPEQSEIGDSLLERQKQLPFSSVCMPGPPATIGGLLLWSFNQVNTFSVSEKLAVEQERVASIAETSTETESSFHLRVIAPWTVRHIPVDISLGHFSRKSVHADSP